MTICKYCEREIIWIKTTSGKMMPCNAEPLSFDDVDEGTKLICEDGTFMASHGVLVDEDDKLWHKPHFGDCPNYKPPSKAKKSIAEEARKQKEKEWGK